MFMDMFVELMQSCKLTGDAKCSDYSSLAAPSNYQNA